MTDIKPVAWCLVYNGPPTNTDIHSDPTMNEYQATAMAKLAAPSVRVAKLYPESALTQAREEGRREGMREAADICEKVLGKRERNPYIDRSAYESACDDCMDAITRAAEGK